MRESIWHYLEVLALLEASASACGCSFGFGFLGLFSAGSLKTKNTKKHHREKIHQWVQILQRSLRSQKWLWMQLKCLKLKRGGDPLTWKPEWWRCQKGWRGQRRSATEWASSHAWRRENMWAWRLLVVVSGRMQRSPHLSPVWVEKVIIYFKDVIICSIHPLNNQHLQDREKANVTIGAKWLTV